jgi:hypothetical protein
MFKYLNIIPAALLQCIMQCFAFITKVWQAALTSVKDFGSHCFIFLHLNPWPCCVHQGL